MGSQFQSEVIITPDFRMLPAICLPLLLVASVTAEAGLKLGDRCNSKSLPCATVNTECIRYQCKCVDGYAQQGDECVPQDTLPLKAKCTTMGARCAAENSECRAFRCLCADGYEQTPEGTGEQCVPQSSLPLGHRCSKQGLSCFNTHSVCSGYRCRCPHGMDCPAPEVELETTTTATTTASTTTAEPTHACGKSLRCEDRSQYCSGGFWTSHKCNGLRKKGKFCTSNRQCLSKSCKWLHCE